MNDILQRIALFVFLNQHNEWTWLYVNFHLCILSYKYILYFEQLSFCGRALETSCLLHLSLLISQETGLKVHIKADGISPSPITNTPINVLVPASSGWLCPQRLSFLSIQTTGGYRMSSQNALSCPLCDHSAGFTFLNTTISQNSPVSHDEE